MRNWWFGHKFVFPQKCLLLAFLRNFLLFASLLLLLFEKSIKILSEKVTWIKQKKFGCMRVSVLVSNLRAPQRRHQ